MATAALVRFFPLLRYFNVNVKRFVRSSWIFSGTKSESGDLCYRTTATPVEPLFEQNAIYRPRRVTHVNYTNHKNRYPVALICRELVFSPTLSNSPPPSPILAPFFALDTPTLSPSSLKHKILSTRFAVQGKKSIQMGRKLGRNKIFRSFSSVPLFFVHSARETQERFSPKRGEDYKRFDHFNGN